MTLEFDDPILSAGGVRLKREVRDMPSEKALACRGKALATRTRAEFATAPLPTRHRRGQRSADGAPPTAIHITIVCFCRSRLCPAIPSCAVLRRCPLGKDLRRTGISHNPALGCVELAVGVFSAESKRVNGEAQHVKCPTTDRDVFLSRSKREAVVCSASFRYCSVA